MVELLLASHAEDDTISTVKTMQTEAVADGAIELINTRTVIPLSFSRIYKKTGATRIAPVEKRAQAMPKKFPSSATSSPNM